MKKMYVSWSRRLLSMILALCMLCTVMPVMAAEGDLGTETNPVTKFSDLQTVLDAASGTESDLAEVYISGLLTATASIKIREGDFIKIIGIGAGENGLKRDASMVQVGSTKPGELIEVQTGGYLELEDIVLDGGAVWSDGADSENSGITPGDSGLFAVRKDAEAILLDGTVLRNNEKGGGGGAIWLVGTLTIDGASIENNKANGNGGAIVVRNDYSKLYLKSGSFTGNYATGDGGAIYIQEKGLVEMSGGEITNNTTADGKSGGAVRVYGTFKMTDGEISGNSAGNSGGAIYLSSTPAVLELTGGEITGNTARATGNGSGGAINMNNSGQVIKLGGAVEITGNKCKTEENNIYLSDVNRTITLTATLTGEVGVSPAFGATVAVKSGKADPAASLESLSADAADPAYALVVSGDNIIYTYAPPSIELDPEKDSYTPGTEVDVAITGYQTGAVLQYKLDDAAEWTEYPAGGFTLTESAKITARAKISDEVYTEEVVKEVIFAGTVIDDFQKLKEAIEAAPTDGTATAEDPTVLYVKGMLQATEKLYLVNGQHIKLIGVGAGESGLIRKQVYENGGDMIDVGNNTSDAACSLELENFVLDGGAVWADGAGSANSGIKAGNSSLMSIRDAASVVLGEGAVLRNNEKSGTGAAFYSKGKLEIDGGEITDNYSNGGDGGAIYMNANNAVTTLSSGKISGNAASDGKSGGAIRVKGTFKMTGGEISGNSAGNSGGAIYLSGTPAALELTGGKITGNIARATGNGSGGAIHMNNSGQVIKVGGSVEITGNKCKTAENNIYLSDTDRTITLTSTLTGKVGVTAIVGTTVAKKSGSADVAASLAKFKLDSEDPNYELAVSEDTIVMQAKELPPFEKLELAIKQAAGTPENPVVIEISGMIEAPRKLVLNDGQHIKLVGVGEGENGLIRSKTYGSGDMIDVGNNNNDNKASLVLENVIIDGGKNVGAPELNSSLVSVRGSAVVTLGKGTILRNNVKSGGGAGVWIVGTLIVDGGKITGNETTGGNNGGGVYLRNPESVLIMKAGEITNNKAAGSSGGGVQVNSRGTVQLAGGKITGNTAENKTNNISVLDGTVQIIGAPAEGDVFGLTLKSAAEGAVAAVRGTGASDAALTAAAAAMSLDNAAVLGFAVDGDNIVVADTTTGCGCADGFAKGNGSAEAPYQITSAELLAHMAEHEGASFKLMTDVEVSDWAPVDLDGNFNGNDCTISGLTDSLFASVSENSTISDLTVEGEIEVGRDPVSVGGVAAESAGALQNVTSAVDITIPYLADQDTMVGGLVGYSTGTASYCEYTGTITDERANSGSFVGEIIGCSAYEAADGLPTMVTAHAGFAAPGGAGDSSEDNMLSNMIKAVNYGADAIEVDVVMSNGVLMLAHGTGALKPDSPSLVDAMKLLMGTHERSDELNQNGETVRIQFDSKQNGILDEILAEIKAQNFPWERVILAGDNSYDHVKENIDAIRAGVEKGMDFWMNPNFILSYDAMANDMDAFLARIEALDLPSFTVNSSYQNITDSIKARFDEEGINVSVWTLNSSSVIKSQITRGMYNTTSRLLECLETRNLLRSGTTGNTFGTDWPEIGSYVPGGEDIFVIDFEVPAGAKVVLTDAEGSEVEPLPDGSYALVSGETYDYAVTKVGYKPGLGSFTVADKDETIEVDLEEMSYASNTPAVSKDQEVEEVEDLIDEIGKVTVDDADLIEEAREAYEDLSASQKKKVSNYDELVEAEEKLEELLAAAEELPFTDVDEDDDCYEAVRFMYENGLMVGVGDGTQFAPAMSLSRAMTARIFHTLEENPAAIASAFTDVVRGFWYTDSIDWASAAGVIAGYGDGTFGPNDDVTREQLAVMLYQYAKSKGYAVDAGAALTQADASAVSFWAAEAVQWAVNNGILTENGVGYLAAGDAATRADVAQAFMVFVQLYA